MAVCWIWFFLLHCLDVFRRQDAIILSFLHQLIDIVVVGKVILGLQSFIEDVQQRIHEVTFNQLWSSNEKEGLERNIQIDIKTEECILGRKPK